MGFRDDQDILEKKAMPCHCRDSNLASSSLVTVPTTFSLLRINDVGPKSGWRVPPFHILRYHDNMCEGAVVDRGKPRG